MSNVVMSDNLSVKVLISIIKRLKYGSA